MTDSIADLLTRIRNALSTKKETVEVPHSKVLEAITKVLIEEGYLEGMEIVSQSPRDIMVIKLRYNYDLPAIQKLVRVSKPGRRVYVKSKDLKPVLSGYGMHVLSTNKGIMTDKVAKQNNVGGEILCRVW